METSADYIVIIEHEGGYRLGDGRWPKRILMPLFVYDTWEEAEAARVRLVKYARKTEGGK
jgi:hypothetical protein